VEIVGILLSSKVVVNKVPNHLGPSLSNVKDGDGMSVSLRMCQRLCKM